MSAMTSVLIAQAQQGDPAAWTTLVQTHAGLVHRLCHRSTPDPEDAFQETWVRIHANLHRFDPTRGTLKSWIAAITRRHLIDRYRRRQRQGTPVVFPSEGVPAKDRPDLTVERALQRERLEAAIARLSDTQRHVVLMHHLHEVPVATLAAELGVPVNTVKTRLHRGRAALAKILREPT